MKQQLSFLATALLLAAASPSSRAQTEMTVDFFYDALADQGDWIEVGDYGYCWQPRDVEESWRPYTVGSWVYTDAGWTWVSEEPHGWATHHYGRWINVEDTGWAWAPDVDWGPAWVSWRSSERHVGWAPLPPEARFERTVGISTWADSYYDIGPENYSFVEVRNMGAPRLRTVLVEPRENITIINETRNITKIVYVNDVVMNEGPQYDTIVQHSAQPIRRLTLQREVAFAGGLEAVRAGRFASRVQGNALQVMAPPVRITQQAVPKKVVRKVTNVTINKGWKNAGPPEQVEKLRAKVKAEAPPPAQLPPQPKFEPVARRGGGGRNAAEAAAPGETATAPAPAAAGDPKTAPMKGQKGGKKPGQPIAGTDKPAHPSATPDQPAGKAASVGSPDETAAVPGDPADTKVKKGGRPDRKGAAPGAKRGGKNQPATSTPAADEVAPPPGSAPFTEPTPGNPPPDAPANTAPSSPAAPPAAGENRPRRGANAPGNRPGRGNRPGQPNAPRGAAPDANPAQPAPGSDDGTPAGNDAKPRRAPGAEPGNRPGRANRPNAPAAGTEPSAGAPDASAAGGEAGRARRNPGAGPAGARPGRPEGGTPRRAKPGQPGAAEEPATEEKPAEAAQ